MKAGDKVRLNSPDCVWHGYVGTVRDVLDGDRWPVSVDFEGEPPYGYSGWGYFRYDEVELVNED